MQSRWIVGLLLVVIGTPSALAVGPARLRPPIPDEPEPQIEVRSDRPIAIGMGMSREKDSPVAEAEEPTKDLPGPGDALPIAVSLLDFTIPPGLNGQTPVGVSVIRMPRQEVQNRGTWFSSQRQEGSAAFPIYIDSPDTLVGTFEVRNTQFQTKTFLESSGRYFPEELWELQPGIAYLRDLGDGMLLGTSLAVTSASDQPFHSLLEIAPAFSGFLRTPAKGDDSWLFSLTYNPVSLVRFPIPGLAYEYNPSTSFQLTLGLPFSVVWKPSESFRFDFAYVPPQSIRSQLTWQPLPWFALFGGFEWVNDSYQLANRQNRRDFFYAYEKRFPVGVRLQLGKNATLDIGGGYAFDRLFFTASQFNEQNRDRVEVNPTAYAMLRFAIQL